MCLILELKFLIAGEQTLPSSTTVSEYNNKYTDDGSNLTTQESLEYPVNKSRQLAQGEI